MAKKIEEKSKKKIEEKKESWPIVNLETSLLVAKNINSYKKYLYKHLVENPTNFDTHFILIDFNGVTTKIDSPFFELHIEEGNMIRYKRREENDAYEVITSLENIRFIMRGLKEKS